MHSGIHTFSVKIHTLSLVAFVVPFKKESIYTLVVVVCVNAMELLPLVTLECVLSFVRRSDEMMCACVCQEWNAILVRMRTCRGDKEWVTQPSAFCNTRARCEWMFRDNPGEIVCAAAEGGNEDVLTAYVYTRMREGWIRFDLAASHLGRGWSAPTGQ